MIKPNTKGINNEWLYQNFLAHGFYGKNNNIDKSK